MIFKVILLPFSFLYLLVVSVRNYLYDVGILKESVFELPVISVGNLRVGGTGKTPHVEYLVRLLKSNYKVAVLSRGYGRKSKGFILADQHADADSIGDESFQIFSKYGHEITVAVGEERALAIPEIKYHKPDVNTIILDDAFQHRAVARDLNILLTEYQRPFFKDLILPSGRLRESSGGAKRADVVIVTKSPDDLSEKEKEKYREIIFHNARKDIPVFFTGIRYQQPLSMDGKIFDIKKKLLLLTAIANPDILEKKIKAEYQLVKHLSFRDHHSYTKEDIASIIQQFDAIEGNEKGILTTEKDMVKLLKPELKEMIKNYPVFYIPIEVYFLENQDLFNKIVLDKIHQKISGSED